jgi:hypothetical protein
MFKRKLAASAIVRVERARRADRRAFFFYRLSLLTCVRPTAAGCVFRAIGAGASWLRLPVPDLRDLADRYATDPDYRLSLIKTKAWKSDRQAAENVRSNPTLILPAQDFEEP